ncbi:hypothetical protein TEQG_07604 [Trichophyton equinum CBS 127.97]|uniref:Uncharacterized protein n=1 Tax=Trichophyton equinum (strain ATCC MYA-4606 / CBS 127.97) TaxID=559882 RepID=F2Q3C4_TRIEC|nr:hypothetical protein TEQG_07604 [Trichophyton equinum CBS 127.97]
MNIAISTSGYLLDQGNASTTEKQQIDEKQEEEEKGEMRRKKRSAGHLFLSKKERKGSEENQREALSLAASSIERGAIPKLSQNELARSLRSPESIIGSIARRRWTRKRDLNQWRHKCT